MELRETQPCLVEPRFAVILILHTRIAHLFSYTSLSCLKGQNGCSCGMLDCAEQEGWIGIYKPFDSKGNIDSESAVAYYESTPCTVKQLL